MPTPIPYESEQEFINRCIPVVLLDGSAIDRSQAYAICESIYQREQQKNGNNESESNQST